MKRAQAGLLAVVCATALMVPATAIAGKGGEHGEHGGKGTGHRSHDVAYVFKGTYAGDGSIEVLSGNARVRKGGFVGQTVAFDLTGAKIVTADANLDGTANLEDVASGDRVLVKAMLPHEDPGAQPFAAKRLIDKTNLGE